MLFYQACWTRPTITDWTSCGPPAQGLPIPAAALPWTRLARCWRPPNVTSTTSARNRWCKKYGAVKSDNTRNRDRLLFTNRYVLLYSPCFPIHVYISITCVVCVPFSVFNLLNMIVYIINIMCLYI